MHRGHPAILTRMGTDMAAIIVEISDDDAADLADLADLSQRAPIPTSDATGLPPTDRLMLQACSRCSLMMPRWSYLASDDAFSITLTTRAFDQCRLLWCATRSCKPIARDLPSSPTPLAAAY